MPLSASRTHPRSFRRCALELPRHARERMLGGGVPNQYAVMLGNAMRGVLTVTFTVPE